MHNKNEYIEKAAELWHIGDNTYCLIETSWASEYMVKVVPDNFDNGDGYWLNDGETWLTKSGAARSILDALHEEK